VEDCRFVEVAESGQVRAALKKVRVPRRQLKDLVLFCFLCIIKRKFKV